MVSPLWYDVVVHASLPAYAIALAQGKPAGYARRIFPLSLWEREKKGKAMVEE